MFFCRVVKDGVGLFGLRRQRWIFFMQFYSTQVSLSFICSVYFLFLNFTSFPTYTQVFTTPDGALALVYECAHTDLEKILENRAIPLGNAVIKQHIKTLLTAVGACHDRWILHRDLKPDNLLFMADGTMKLADFGLARMYGTPKTKLSPQAITLWYKPPELLLVCTK